MKNGCLQLPSQRLCRKQAGDVPPQLTQTSLKVTERRRRRLKLEEEEEEEEEAVLCCKATEGNEAWKRSAEPGGPRCRLGISALETFQADTVRLIHNSTLYPQTYQRNCWLYRSRLGVGEAERSGKIGEVGRGGARRAKC